MERLTEINISQFLLQDWFGGPIALLSYLHTTVKSQISAIRNYPLELCHACSFISLYDLQLTQKACINHELRTS